MEWKEALPLLQENHTGVAISVTPKGRAQSTVVECRGSHAVYVSQPAAVAALIESAAKELQASNVGAK